MNQTPHNSTFCTRVTDETNFAHFTNLLITIFRKMPWEDFTPFQAKSYKAQDLKYFTPTQLSLINILLGEDFQEQVTENFKPFQAKSTTAQVYLI